MIGKCIVLWAVASLSFGLEVEAQRFYWGYPSAGADENYKSITHFFDNDEVYRLSSHYDMSIFNYRISADRFSADSLVKLESVDNGLPQPIMGLNMAKHETMFQLKGGDFVFFSRETNRETSENVLYWQTGDIGTGVRTDRQQLSSITGKSNSNNGKFIVEISPNKNYYVVLKEPAFVKKSMEQIEVELYDASFKLVGTLVYDFPYEVDRVPKHSLNVDNNGNVYIIKRFDLPKIKPYCNIYVWKRGANTLVEESLQQPDNFQIDQVYPYFDNGNYYFAALLTQEGATTIGLRIDQSGRYSGVSGSALLMVSFASDGGMRYKVRNDFKVVSNLSIKEILPTLDKHWVVMERMDTEKKSSSTNPMDENQVYTYSYLSNGFFILGLEPSSGKMEWQKPIDTAEPNTINDSGVFLSVLPLVRDGNLVLLYNETRDVRDGMGNNRKKRFPIMEVIAPSGETIERTPILNAGVGVNIGEIYDLDTSFITQISESKYLIRANDRSTVKYGYLTF